MASALRTALAFLSPGPAPAQPSPPLTWPLFAAANPLHPAQTAARPPRPGSPRRFPGRTGTAAATAAGGRSLFPSEARERTK